MVTTAIRNGDIERRPLVSIATARACLSGQLALVVDDDSASFGHIFVSLASAGCRAVLARRWSQAAHHIERAGNPSLIIFSTSLRDTDAAALIRAARAFPKMSSALLIALTNQDSRREQRLLRALGCDGYLSKPADRFLFAAELVRRTARLTDGSGAAAASAKLAEHPSASTIVVPVGGP